MSVARDPVRFEVGGITLLRALRRKLQQFPGLVERDETVGLLVTDSPTAEVLRAENQALQFGARDEGPNRLTTRDPSLVLAAATLVIAGHTVYPCQTRADPELQVPELSPRQREVADWLVRGASDKEVARALGISAHTARFHADLLRRKLGARNRLEAVSILLGREMG